MRTSVSGFIAPTLLILALSACGGGDPTADAPSDSATSAAPAPAAVDTAAAGGGTTSTSTSTPPADASAAALPSGDLAQPAVQVQGTAPSDAQRIAAATATAQNTGNPCSGVRPFYWEIGNRNAALASGSVKAVGSVQTVKASTPMNIASASKWIYGAWVAQKDAGVLSDSDRRFLSMRSGYVNLKNCDKASSVDNCLATQGNGDYTASADGKFDYDGGHMEKHASLNGLGSLGNKALASAVQAQIGTDVPLAYTQPLLAGGLLMSPDAYARVLRKMLGGQLQIGALLGTGAVCTNPSTCGRNNALYAPLPASESWHYSVAHWVEDDPIVGDGAFSSPGAFGFYPWIDRSKTWYGVLARVVANGAFSSVQCGRLIRKAWTTGLAQ